MNYDTYYNIWSDLRTHGTRTAYIIISTDTCVRLMLGLICNTQTVNTVLPKNGIMSLRDFAHMCLYGILDVQGKV